MTQSTLEAPAKGPTFHPLSPIRKFKNKLATVLFAAAFAVATGAVCRQVMLAAFICGGQHSNRTAQHRTGSSAQLSSAQHSPTTGPAGAVLT